MSTLFSTWFVAPEQIHSSYFLLAVLGGLGLAVALLYKIGVIDWAFWGLGVSVRGSIRGGFRLWEALLAWASWPVLLALVGGFIVVGVLGGSAWPALSLLCGLTLLLMGAISCLAYMFIDLERFEVERGRMAIHNPMKGQAPAMYLALYGHQLSIPLLIAATLAMTGGFALLNHGLYATIGRGWYRVEGPDAPAFVDFLAYTLTNFLNIVHVLDLAKSHHWLRAPHVQQAAWQASALLVAFKAFFSLVLLQQIFASLRQGKLLAETIADFWSPHGPIHERARNTLAQFGGGAIGPLLVSLRSVPSLTKEQRDQLPLILTTIGPSTIPALLRHLNDPHESVRAIAATALGKLHAVDAVLVLTDLAQDPSDVVRQSVVEALGVLGGVGIRSARKGRGMGRLAGMRGRWSFRWNRWKKPQEGAPTRDLVELAVEALESALADRSAAVRTQAALGLGRIGTPAAAVVHGLIALLDDADETVRCQAAEALGLIGGDERATVAALVVMLQDASAPVKASAARALGVLKTAAAPAVGALVPLLQDRDDEVRAAAAEAIAQVGPLDEEATDNLTEGLASPDNVVRAQTAEALGTIGASAEEAAPALVEAMTDLNDRVRAKAVEALGKIGESAAETAVPGLMRALRDRDNWVSALAAEALGEMGESADAAIPALVRSLSHPNGQVRVNAAEALGKMGGSAASARSALEKAARDEDGGVRGQAIRSLGEIGKPTAVSARTALDGFLDADPLVRAAAVEAVGRWNDPNEGVLSGLILLLEDANDQVKVEATRVLPRLAGSTPDVIDGLCRRLLEDDSTWVQFHAALALGKLGPEAAAAGGALLRAARMGEVTVREQALRAISMIQPPETTEALAAGLKDDCGDIRIVASAGWMKAATIPDEVVPNLIEALRDPEVQVRANAAHALSRLDELPATAIPLLIDCTADGNDSVRMNAAMALKVGREALVAPIMQQLVADSNSRIRLIAASFVLSVEPQNEPAGMVMVEALSDPTLRVRKAALELVESLGESGAGFLEAVLRRADVEDDSELCEIIERLVERLQNRGETVLPPVEPQS